MADRKRSIRVKIFTILLVPVVSLAAIWGFAAAVTVGKGVQLLQVNNIFDNVIVPLRSLSSSFQHERLVSVQALGSPGRVGESLQQQRAETDRVAAHFKELAVTSDVRDDMPADMSRRIDDVLNDIARLPDIRDRVDGRGYTVMQIIDTFSTFVDDIQQVFDQLLIVPDLDLIEQTKAVLLMRRAREQLSQESAVIAGVVAAKRMTMEEYTAFGQMVVKRKLLYDMGFQQLDTRLRQPFFELQNTGSYDAFESAEQRVIAGVRPGRPLPADAASWTPAIEDVVLKFDLLVAAAGQEVTDRGEPQARAIFLQIGIAAGLGLIAVFLSIFVSLRFGRRIAAELVRLQQSALRLATERLPAVVARLRRGEDVDDDAEPQILVDDGTTEIASVGEAFASVQRTAIEAAVGQAELRKGVGKVFLNLARRNQSLLHRQLSMLDKMERGVSDPEILEGLYGLDHLTTRMRRHAEGLIILSGAQPGRGWRNPVPFFDVVRGAAEEVEDYLRVNVSVPHGPALTGSAVTDVVHLIAELVENATIFSPPHTTVYVRGGAVGRGFVVEVEDRGLGLSREEYDQINERLANPPEFDLADSDRLGLFVVGRLAARQNINVCLRPSPYGGTTAILLIPSELVVDAEAPAVLGTLPDRSQGTAPGAPLAGSDITVERIVQSAPVPAGSAAGAAREPTGAGKNGAATKNGATTLPRRVRQANLAPQLREPLAAPVADGPHDAPHGADGAGPDPAPDGTDSDAATSGEEAPRLRRDLLTSFPAGWRLAHDGDEEDRR
jgi:signal transduction histidine kinase